MFHVGQKVVYIGTDLSFDPKPGKTIHVIHGIRKSFCTCNDVLIDVGIFDSSYNNRWCPFCGGKERAHDGIRWKLSLSFRPLETTYTESEIESVDISEITQEEVITV